jgi:DNA repair protein RadC
MTTKFTTGEIAGTYVATGTLTEQDILEMANTISKRKFYRGRKFTSAQDAMSYLQCLMQDETHEIFGMICLDTQHRVIGRFNLFHGTINEAAVYPREVVKRALFEHAGAVILFHNHPSGLSSPSQADIRLTRDLKSALETVEIQVLDHIVVGRDDVTSLAQQGLM